MSVHYQTHPDCSVCDAVARHAETLWNEWGTSIDVTITMTTDATDILPAGRHTATYGQRPQLEPRYLEDLTDHLSLGNPEPLSAPESVSGVSAPIPAPPSPAPVESEGVVPDLDLDAITPERNLIHEAIKEHGFELLPGQTMQITTQYLDGEPIEDIETIAIVDNGKVIYHSPEAKARIAAAEQAHPELHEPELLPSEFTAQWVDTNPCGELPEPKPQQTIAEILADASPERIEPHLMAFDTVPVVKLRHHLEDTHLVEPALVRRHLFESLNDQRAHLNRIHMQEHGIELTD